VELLEDVAYICVASSTLATTCDGSLQILESQSGTGTEFQGG